MRKLATATLVGTLALSLAACSGSKDEPASSASGDSQLQTTEQDTDKGNTGAPADLDSVKITHEGKDKVAADFKNPLKGEKATAKLVNKGDGAKLKDGQSVQLRLATFDAETGKELQPGSFKQPQALTLDKDALVGVEGLYDGLKEATVGSDIAYFITSPSVDSPQLWVIHVEDAKDPSVKWKKSSEKGDKPSLDKGKKDTYTVTIPESDAPKKLQVDVIDEGTKGPKATKESMLTVRYSGAKWSDAKQFDGNFDAPEPSTFGLNQVIQGWTEGLEGLKAGTTVLLTIPGDKAYGEESPGDTGNPPKGALVFLVTIEKVETQRDATDND